MNPKPYTLRLSLEASTLKPSNLNSKLSTLSRPVLACHRYGAERAVISIVSALTYTFTVQDSGYEVEDRELEV